MDLIQKVAIYSGKPYFLVESPAGQFGVLKSFFINPHDKSRLSFVVDKNELELNLDIVEIPLGGQAICVESPFKDPEFGSYEITRHVVWELKNYARNCNRDFVSYHPFQGGFGIQVGGRAGMVALTVEPRIFRLT